MGLEIEYIYGQTPLTEEEKEELLIKHISTREELDEFEQFNIEKLLNQKVFSWGQENISKNTNTRKIYIDSILEADQGNIKPLLKFARSM